MRPPLPTHRLTLWGLLGVFMWVTVTLALFHHHSLPAAISARAVLRSASSAALTQPAVLQAAAGDHDHDPCEMCLYEGSAFPLGAAPLAIPGRAVEAACRPAVIQAPVTPWRSRSRARSPPILL